jgi:hypothetical protein
MKEDVQQCCHVFPALGMKGLYISIAFMIDIPDSVDALTTHEVLPSFPHIGFHHSEYPDYTERAKVLFGLLQRRK